MNGWSAMPLNLQRFRLLKIFLIALLVLGFAGTAGFHYIEHWPWFDCFYMVITTFTTIGYQEVHPLSHAGRVFNSFLIIAGVSLVFMMIGALTQALLEFELGKVFGRRRMEREVAGLKNHYIICGAGRVGHSVAAELARKPCPFVVIESGEKAAAELDPKWPVITGDAASEKVLREAGIDRALGLVAATTTDATNIYIVLTARSLNPRLKIIARASEERAGKHLKTAGADAVISPYAAAGHRIAQSFLRPKVLDFLDIATARSGTFEMIIEEIRVSEGSSLASATVGSSGIHHQFGIMILAIRHVDGDTRFNPNAQDPICAGDYLIAMGEPAQLVKLEALASATVTATP
ncbi:MAG TPA: potassium channel protein [Candidatus Limnocylindrales bacterium]|jgi:voltage-gated potassium channel|nr:potassium channel protein [Candidatus Limnocylindrales bacterium]